MKNIIKAITVIVLLNIGNCINTQKANAQVNVSFQVFYDELSPYGNWVDNSDYGYVWVPDVAPGFTPYGSNGYWVFTEAGWTWVSNYPWGWAPFHYGRWFTDPIYGPIWVPDNEWGPGWVTWRRSEGYFGWAPIGPGVSISVAYSNAYNLPYNQWVFVRRNDFGRPNISNYYVNSSNNVTIINNTTVINNIHTDNSHNVTYNSGPERKEVEKYLGKKITPVEMKENSKPGQKLNDHELIIYKPHFGKNNDDIKPTPKKVASMNDLKPVPQRKEGAAPKNNNQPAEQPHKMQPEKSHPGHKNPQNGQPGNEQPAPRSKGEQQDQQLPVKQPEKTVPHQEHTTHPQSDQPGKKHQVQQPGNVEKQHQPSQKQPHDQPERKQQQHQQNNEQQQQSPGRPNRHEQKK